MYLLAAGGLLFITAKQCFVWFVKFLRVCLVWFGGLWFLVLFHEMLPLKLLLLLCRCRWCPPWRVVRLVHFSYVGRNPIDIHTQQIHKSPTNAMHRLTQQNKKKTHSRQRAKQQWLTLSATKASALSLTLM